MEGRGRSHFSDDDRSDGGAERGAFPLTIREILRRRRLSESEAETAARAEADAEDSPRADPTIDEAPAPAPEPVPDMRASTPVAPNGDGHEAELDRLRAENDELRLRVESAERQIDALRASKVTRWNRVAVLPTSGESG